ncbi:DUF6545 domain-containing protein [Micromonospora sp. WMMD737]|uniref:DUF6545 domain-containing protein n=1 Tax=Micromonospora sp. WMMD737 TaxID=3404113 RepID=UPI003B95D3ED
MDAWCEAIGRQRGRPVRIRDEPFEFEAEVPSGVLVPLDRADYILVDASLPTLARAQTVLHEVAHLVLGHDGDAMHSTIDPALEAEAELAADLLYQQMTRAAAKSGRRRGDSLARVPSWRPSAWWADRRADWRVNQLWIKLRAGMPDATIVSTTTGVQVPVEVGGSRHRHRRVIEVHDALRLLRPWCSRQVHASARRRAHRYRLDPALVEAVADAAMLAVALRRRQAALPVVEDPLDTTPSVDVFDVRGETRRLARISCAWLDSPVVAAEVARWVPVVASASARSDLLRPSLAQMLPVSPLPEGIVRRDRSSEAVQAQNSRPSG